jgi:biotin carboxyl carrier protein
MIYQVTANSQRVFQVKAGSGYLELDGKKLDWSVLPLVANQYSVIAGHRSRRVLISSVDAASGIVVLRLGAREYALKVEDSLQQVIRSLGLSRSALPKSREILAPMPGLVLKILVKTGQQLQAGDPVLILEAMKMENLYKSPGPGTVKNIRVTEGSAVEKGSVLVILE